jgi:hypothetical protein
MEGQRLLNPCVSHQRGLARKGPFYQRVLFSSDSNNEQHSTFSHDFEEGVEPRGTGVTCRLVLKFQGHAYPPCSVRPSQRRQVNVAEPDRSEVFASLE